MCLISGFVDAMNFSQCNHETGLNKAVKDSCWYVSLYCVLSVSDNVKIHGSDVACDSVSYSLWYLIQMSSHVSVFTLYSAGYRLLCITFNPYIPSTFSREDSDSVTVFRTPLVWECLSACSSFWTFRDSSDPSRGHDWLTGTQQGGWLDALISMGNLIGCWGQLIMGLIYCFTHHCPLPSSCCDISPWLMLNNETWKAHW